METQGRNTFLPGNEKVGDCRKRSLDIFQELGVPGKRNEDYKYSPTDRIFSAELDFFLPNGSDRKIDLRPFSVRGLDTCSVVLLNGRFSAINSHVKDLPKGVILCSLREAFDSHQELVNEYFDKNVSQHKEALAALNTTFAEDGVFLFIPENCVLAKPIHIISLFDLNVDALLQPRHLFIVGKRAGAEVFESFCSLGDPSLFTLNSLTEVAVGAEASLRYYILQNAGDLNHHVCNTYARLNEKSHFDTNTITLSGRWIRNNLRIAIDAKDGEAHLNGLIITQGDQHVDNNTLVDHRFPGGQSFQLYKGILGGRSTGIFNGKIYVKPDAQKTNAYQSSKNILLSDDASINAKPQLEIYADDVKCSHGSSTGKLDEEALFYLRSRGMGEEGAKKLLLLAFCTDVLETVKNETLRDHLQQLIESKINN